MIGLALVSLLMFSCSQPQPTPTSTPILPEPTVKPNETLLPEIPAEYTRLPINAITNATGELVGGTGPIALPTEQGANANTDAGFIMMNEGKTLEIAFIDPTTNMGLVVEVTGKIEWDELSRVRSGSQNFLRIKLVSGQWLEIVDREFNNGLLVLIDENGSKYMITQLSYQPRGSRTFRLLPGSTPTP